MQALLADGLPVVTTFPGTLPPLGNITVAGADNGLTFGLAVEGSSAQLVFDGTLGRPVNTTETGEPSLLLPLSPLHPRFLPPPPLPPPSFTCAQSRGIDVSAALEALAPSDWGVLSQ